MRQLKITQGLHTNIRTESFKKYLNDVTKLDLISQEKEIELAERIAKGDKKAVDELVKANLRFVISVAKQYEDGICKIEDLVTEGNMGLYEAAQRFDHTKGFKFISYAVWWIRRYIMEYKTNYGRTIRIPANKVSEMNKVVEVSLRLENELGRKPSIDEILEDGSLDMERYKIEEALKMSENNAVASLDKVIGEEGYTLLDTLTDPNNKPTDHLLSGDDSVTNINKLLSMLNEQERTIVTMYFGLHGGEGMGLREIGDEVGLSRERIRQIKDRACRRLRWRLNRIQNGE